MWLCTRIRVGRSCSALKVWKRPRHRSEVVGVGDRRHVPAVGDEARRHVLGEGDVGVPLDGHPVGVVDPAQLGEGEVPCQRGRLRGDALHHATVSRQGVDVEVEEGHAVAVVALGQPSAGDRHAHRGRHALAQRPGRGLDPAGPAVLGMPRAVRAELAEGLEVLERDGRPAAAPRSRGRPPAPCSGAAGTTTASRRGPRTARSGPGWARSGRRGRSAGTAATRCRQPARCPWGSRGDPSSPFALRPCTGPGWC